MAERYRASARGRVGQAFASRPAWQRHVLLIFVLGLFAAPILGYQSVHDRKLSIIDEWQYADRVHQVSTGDLWMSNGEYITEWGQDIRACRGIIRLVEPVPDCRNAEPVISLNSAAADPAPYYVATGLLTAVLRITGVAENALIGGRLVGILWAALSMWTLILVSRAMGAGRIASAVAASSVVLIPAIAQQYSYVSPHALDIPVGALAVLATLKFLRREWPWWPLVAAGFGVGFVKSSNVVIVVALGVALLAILVWPRVFDRAQRLRALVAGVVLAASSLGFTLVSMLIISATTIGDPDPPGNYLVDSLDPWAVYIDSLRFVAPSGEGPLHLPATWIAAAMVGTAMAVWAGLASDSASYVRQLAPGYLLGAALGAVVLDVMVFVTTGQYISVSSRYGLALMPLSLGFLALLARTRTAQVLIFAMLVLFAAVGPLAGLDALAA